MREDTGPTTVERVEAAALAVAERGIVGSFDLAIVLGSGLGTLAGALDDVTTVSYADIPHFPRPGVSGHGGRLLSGRWAGRRVLVLAGRAHGYETGDSGIMRVPIGLVAALGTGALLLTNAAGGIRPDLSPGSLVAVTDHIGIGAPNPLVGETGDDRFVAMGDAYDPGLRAALGQAGATSGVALAEGVYMWFSGPSFETAAEIRAARALGADLVGMSTVPEVILARRTGLRVAAVSVVTNFATGLGSAGHSHPDTQSAAAAAAGRLRILLTAFVEHLGHG